MKKTIGAALLLASVVVLVGGERTASAYECGEGGGSYGDPGQCGGGDPPPPPPLTNNRILYFTGRGHCDWPVAGFLPHSAAWTDINLYNGNSSNGKCDNRLSDSTLRTYLKNQLVNNCTASCNQCVLVCASMGCARMLQAVDDALAAGNTLHVAWVGAYASAAGGSEIASVWTKGIRRLLAKVLGNHKPVDDDLPTAFMRGNMAHIQNRAPAPMYHTAGGKDDWLAKIIGNWKIWGNKYLPCRVGDGAVPPHSSGGYATAGCHFNINDGTSKFVNRQHEHVALLDMHHIDTIKASVFMFGAPRLATTTTIPASCGSTGQGSSAGPEASTADDSMDYAAAVPTWSCADPQQTCLTGGSNICDTTDVDTRPTSTVLPASPYCGDSECSNGEDSNTCASDCPAPVAQYPAEQSPMGYVFQ